MLRNKRFWILAAYLFTAAYLTPMFPHGGSANELTRWATAASLVEKGSFEISWTEPLIGPNVDTAVVGDQTYSNKAPGTAILAAPVYALARIFIGPPNASNIRVSWYAMRFCLSTLPLFFLALWLYRRKTDQFALATLLFATPLFLYSLLFFSHVLVAVCVYLAFRLLFDNNPVKQSHCLLAGILSGLAVICEFPAIFPVLIFAIGLIFSKAGRWARLSFFGLGGLPFLLFLLAYNNSLFGSPWSMSYSHESFSQWSEVANQGLFGISFPTVSNFYLLLVSPSRGLLFTAPVLILAVAAFIKNYDKTDLRLNVLLAAVLITFVVICGHGAAHGGWAFGPRYLILIVPLILDPLFRGVYKPPSIVAGIAFAISLLLCILPALTFPFAPPEFVFPHNDLWMKLITTENWIVPNAGNLISGLGGMWALFPVFIAFAIVVFVIVRQADRPGRFLAGVAVGTILVFGYILWPISAGKDDAAFRRDTIAERYFIPSGRLDKYREAAVRKGDWNALRRVNDFEWTIADSWAYAPDNFPYQPAGALPPSPFDIMKKAVKMEKTGDASGAEGLLDTGGKEFGFGKCEFSTGLAVIYYTSGRKDKALNALEDVQPLVNPASRPDCLRSEYLLGRLDEETGRESDANMAFRQFAENSASSDDDEIKAFRKSLNLK